MPLLPPTDAARTAMIRCYIESYALDVRAQNLPSGTYRVYAYVWQSWNDPDAGEYTLSLQGQVVATYAPGSQRGVWQRLGPWLATVTDGELALTTLSPTGAIARLSGIELWSVGG